MSEATKVVTEPEFYTIEEFEEIKTKIRSYMLMTEAGLDFANTPEGLDRNCRIIAVIANDAKKHGFDDKIVNAYIDYPPFIFYTDSSYSSIRRIYGFGENDKGDVCAHAVSAMIMFNNDVVGGVPINQLVYVKQWSESQLSKLNSGLIKGADAFLEPNGYMCFAR